MPEPDWDTFREMLEQVDSWIRSDASMGENAEVFLLAAVSLTQARLNSYVCPEEGETTDDMLRDWVRWIEWNAWWFHDYPDDPALKERIRRLCEQPGQIAKEIADAGASAAERLTCEGSA